MVEINQARALAGGVTDTDAPGFPVTLGAPGSYRLTSDLRVPDLGTDAIDVGSDDVTVDLGGFSIFGPNACAGRPAVGTGSGAGDGIVAATSVRVRVRNGRIRGMGGHGVDLHGGVVEDLVASQNGLDGVRLGAESAAERVGASQNGFTGIELSSGRVADATAEANGDRGIAFGSSGVVSRSVALSNGSTGFLSSGRGVIADSHAELNGTDGFRSLLGTISRCLAATNGAHGFRTNGGLVESSTASANVGFGLYVPNGRAAYQGNVFTDNNAGAQVQVGVGLTGAAHALGSNLCGTDTTCP